VEVESIEHRGAVVVREVDSLEDDLSAAVGRQRAPTWRVGDERVGRQHLVHAARRRRHARRHRDHHPAHAQRPDEHEDVRVEGDELADLHLAVEHEVAAVPEDHHEGDGRKEVDEGQERGTQA
jgi:hypothetical protein